MNQNEKITAHENHGAEKKEAFEKQQIIMEKINKIGFAHYTETLPNLKDAFDLNKHKLENHSRCVCCMDEGTPEGIHSAGSGILLSEEDLETYVRVAQPDAISSHDGCGAGKLYCRAHGLPEKNSDQIAREWAEDKAKKYNLPHIHVSTADMKRPTGFHDARVCYYDATGKINNDSSAGLPKGFVISRAYMKKENCLAEASVAMDIIFGDHGLGELLTEKNPFVIIAVAKNEKELEEIKKEITELKNPYGDRVRFGAFLAKMPE